MGGSALNQGVLEGDDAPGQVRARTFRGVDDEGWPGGSEALRPGFHSPPVPVRAVKSEDVGHLGGPGRAEGCHPRRSWRPGGA